MKLDRRTFWQAILTTSGLLPSTYSAAGPLSEEVSDPQTEWFDQFFAAKPPVGALHLYRFADEIYGLTSDIGWKPPAGIPYNPITVPRGFITDLASIPQIFWSIIPRDGKYTYPAIVHDYMYWIQDRPREEADEIFKIGMSEFGIGSVAMNAIYWGVRAGGGSAWDSNAKLRAKGELRIVKRFPQDPLVPWTEWKKLPNVFP